MLGLFLTLSALAMSPREAVDAAEARSPALDLSDARTAEAEARLREVTGRLLPTVSLTGALVAQTEIEASLADRLPDIPLIDPDSIEPLLVQPGLQAQGGAQLWQPIVAPAAWVGRGSASLGVEAARAERDADASRVARRTLEVWHQAALAHATLDDARRAEDLAVRLAEKGDKLAEIGAVADADVLPFRRAVAGARANTALATEAVAMTDGVLRALTGLDGVVDPPASPGAPLPVEQLLATMDRPDLRAASARIDAARSRIGAERTGLYPTVGLTAQVMAVTPSADFGKELTWRVGLGASIPLFQGGVVGAKVDAAAAQAGQATAGERALREGAEIEVRMAHGALASALASQAEHEEAVRLSREATSAAERRVDEGGGSLLQLQQAQLEQVAAELRLTRARLEAARAADLLTLAVYGRL